MLNEMEKLELYNIGNPGREVYPKAKIYNWRSRILDKLLRMGLIVENPDYYVTRKAFILTPAGEEVWPTIVSDAQNTIIDFRNKGAR